MRLTFYITLSSHVYAKINFLVIHNFVLDVLFYSSYVTSLASFLVCFSNVSNEVQLQRIDESVGQRGRFANFFARLISNNFNFSSLYVMYIIA